MISIITKYFPSLLPETIQQYEALYPLYSEWNQRINVISRQDIENLYERHILHSLSIAKVVSFQAGATVLDVGTGGGFPGLPLAILFPQVHFHLMDSIGKKLKVIQAIADELHLTNITVEHNRIEAHNETYDFITGRAITDLPVFANWVKKNISKKHNHVIPNGILYLKGGEFKQDIKSCQMGYREYAISDFFNEPFFETKKIVHLFK